MTTPSTTPRSPKGRSVYDADKARRAFNSMRSAHAAGKGGANDATVQAACAERGFSHAMPRCNVFTRHIWTYLGRDVRPGEKAVRVQMSIPCRWDEAGNVIGSRKWRVSLFHIDQTTHRQACPVSPPPWLSDAPEPDTSPEAAAAAGAPVVTESRPEPAPQPRPLETPADVFRRFGLIP